MELLGIIKVIITHDPGTKYWAYQEICNVTLDPFIDGRGSSNADTGIGKTI